jgi:hypothetical protein
VARAARQSELTGTVDAEPVERKALANEGENMTSCDGGEVLPVRLRAALSDRTWCTSADVFPVPSVIRHLSRAHFGESMTAHM